MLPQSNCICEKSNLIVVTLKFIQYVAENEDFDQRLGCPAPKHWLKYTTAKINKLNNFINVIVLLLLLPT